MKLYFLLDKENRERLEKVYQKLTGKKLVPPKQEAEKQAVSEQGRK